MSFGPISNLFKQSTKYEAFTFGYYYLMPHEARGSFSRNYQYNHVLKNGKVSACSSRPATVFHLIHGMPVFSVLDYKWLLKNPLLNPWLSLQVLWSPYQAQGLQSVRFCCFLTKRITNLGKLFLYGIFSQNTMQVSQ